jgi:peptide-methionine (S)-S-oxide reductase
MGTEDIRDPNQSADGHLPPAAPERAQEPLADARADEQTTRSGICTLASGCFWCTEAVFKRLKGVQTVRSGYAASQVPHPSYKQVCSGTTGAAEAIQVTYDPTVVSYTTLLEVFWATHDPTTLNRQGNDVGTQYRSAIFYHNEEQKRLAVASKEALEASEAYKHSVVTEISAFTNFYLAEKYHEDYYSNNRFQPYCMLVIDPKVKKLLKTHQRELKAEYQQ